jgi:hypothetical protein
MTQGHSKTIALHPYADTAGRYLQNSLGIMPEYCAWLLSNGTRWALDRAIQRAVSLVGQIAGDQYRPN